MYAYFVANKYYIDYYGNNNTGGSVGRTTCTYDQDCTLANNGFTRTGYTYSKWAQGSVSGTQRNQGTNVRNLANTNGATINMYAIWTVNKYNVSITNLGGGTISPSSINVNYGGSNTFTVTPNTGYYLENVTCSNGYTSSGYTTGTTSIGTQTVTVTNNSYTDSGSCSVSFKVLCPYSLGDYWEFNYTGGVQEFKAECKGTYKLEVWGAQGGSSSTHSGGKGGYSYGNISLDRDKYAYIVIGQSKEKGGASYNGGGGVSDDTGKNGGGATHIATTNRGELENYDSYRNEVLIVAGGGGGAMSGTPGAANGGAGGGLSGTGGEDGGYGGGIYLGNGGKQTEGGSSIGSPYTSHNEAKFGLGGSPIAGQGLFAGGGGGWYGGGTTYYYGGGGGGSGYIGGVINGSTQSGIREGNGYAKITLISLND